MELTALDYEQIRHQLAALAMDVDFGRGDAYAARFTDDATMTTVGLQVEGDHAGIHRGRTEIAQMVTTLYEGTQGHCRHWNGLPAISASESGASVASYFQVVRIGQVPEAGIILTGIYFDEFRQVDGQWLFASRVCSIDPQPENGVVSTDVLVVARDKAVGAA
jgi:hypothetical protein